MDFSFSLTHILSVFVVLFALIDALGSIPVFLGLKASGRDIHPLRSAIYAFAIMFVFMFVGEWVLNLFNIDVSSFAIAGGLVIFVISLEMVFGVQILKNDAPGGTSSFVPIVFPLIAGPATFTALLTMRAQFSVVSITIGLFLNMVIVFLVLNYLGVIQKAIGVSGVYVARKFFGIILMAISVKVITNNIMALLSTL